MYVDVPENTSWKEEVCAPESSRKTAKPRPSSKKLSHKFCEILRKGVNFAKMIRNNLLKHPWGVSRIDCGVVLWATTPMQNKYDLFESYENCLTQTLGI